MKINLEKYENLYNYFDEGHNKIHLKEVRENAIYLGKKYAPDKLEIIYVAATLHDIGISISRENHEKHGYEIIKKDLEIKRAYTREDFLSILEAIREHRASTGNPKSTIAKIIADANRTPYSTGRSLKRSYDYNREHFQNLSHREILQEVAKHIYNKYGPNGYGTKLHFKESREKHKKVYKKICKEIEKGNLEEVERCINQVSFAEEEKKH